MPAKDTLAEALGISPATALRKELALRNQTVEVDHSGWEARGYTGAVLAAVVVKHVQADNPGARRCIAKVCPPTNGQPEASQHSASLLHTFRPEFVRDHLVGIAFEPVQCPDGQIVVGQEIAGGNLSSMQPLSKHGVTQLGKVCRVVRRGLLEDWTGQKVRMPELTVPEMLSQELKGFTDAWPPADVRWIMTDEDGTMPNPLALVHDARLAAARRKPYFMGHSHGDLHFDNLLVPATSGGVAIAEKFRLIDLAGFEPWAPLSRDLATLLISILAHRVRALDLSESDALLHYLINPEQRSSEAPYELAAVIEELRDPGEAHFAADWRELWDDQLQVSIVAAALRHTTYKSVGPEGRWWCLRLAGLLAQVLISGRRADDDPLRLTPDMFGSEAGQGPVRRRVVKPGPTVVNQDSERMKLLSAILEPGPGVILVHGVAGVGKSALADGLVAQLRAADVRAVKHDAAGHYRSDAMTLMEDLEDGAASERLRPGESVFGRLAAALDALDSPMAIVIDQADALMDGETNAIVDQELDEALELLAAGPDTSLARVILVARKPPRSARDRHWPERAMRVKVQGLHEPHFQRFLARLDVTENTGLAALKRHQLGTLRDRLQGNPAQAGLAHLIVCADGSEYGAGTLVEELAIRLPEDVPQFLADIFMDQLTNKTKLLLAALSAFGTPVQASLVANVVADRLPERSVTAMLENLVRQRIIVVDDGHYGLPPSDPYRFLDKPPVDAETWRKMLHIAATQLGHHLKRSVHDLHDLHLHFVLIDVLLRSGRYEAAHDIVDLTDQHLRCWDQEVRLLGRREYLSKQLTDPHRSMSNLNDLGDLYTTRGRFSDALGAYRSALDVAARLDDPPNRLRIQINMAAMHMEAGETEDAADLFSLVLAEGNMRDVDAEDCMAANEGLADCHRRWGEYREALTLVRRALAIARQVGSDRTVTIALKAARWYAELGDLAAADQYIAEAEELAEDCEDYAPGSACIDARADLKLDQGRPHEALELVDGMLAATRWLRSPVVLLQAQTIRCMAQLQLGDVSRAYEAIDAADRYRRKGRSLIVPALRALATALNGDPDEAERCFADLLGEACLRNSDPKDVGGLQFLGYAHCWPALTNDVALRVAAKHFRSARIRTNLAALGVEALFTYLVKRLDELGGRPGRLQPVLDAITGASPPAALA